MAHQRGIDGSEPLRAQPLVERAGVREDRRAARSWTVGTGTLACPRCDAPIAPLGRVMTPAQDLDCPFCLYGAPVRDFLSLATPSRPARVEVRVRPGARGALR